MTRQVSISDPQQALLLARSHTIGSYGGVEQALCEIFTTLAGLERDVGGLIFFKIVNASVRLRIIDELLKKRFQTQYSEFWRSAKKHVQSLDEERNRIVHWTVGVAIKPQNGTIDFAGPTEDAWLHPPNIWWKDTRDTRFDIHQMLEFAWKAEFVSKMLGVLSRAASPVEQIRSVNPKEWTKLLGAAFAFPPPPTHPFYTQKPKYRPPGTAK